MITSRFKPNHAADRATALRRRVLVFAIGTAAASLNLALPNNPGLLGVDLFAQGVVLESSGGRARTTAHFECSLHDYFTALFSTEPQPLRAVPQEVLAQQPEFAGDLPRFARETIL